jgi:hypothetical protein
MVYFFSLTTKQHHPALLVVSAADKPADAVLL